MEATQGGLLLVDKSEGWTSHDVVAKSRRALHTRKIGHAGTLDPMATGLLLLGVGPATRLLTHLVGLDKTYTATIRLGETTLTDDREGETLSRATAEAIAAVAADRAAVMAAVLRLTGNIEQAPSAVSAIKVDGKRAYDRVRAGEEVQLKTRPVTVHEFDVHEVRTGDAAIDIDVTVRCSSGTYVRALARDLGAILGIGGHLIALRRTHVGPFDVAAAVSNEALAAGEFDGSALLAPAAVASSLFPVLQLSSEQAVDLGHGKRVRIEPEVIADAPLVAALAPDGTLVGLVAVEHARTRVITNFPSPQPAATQPSEEAM